MNFFGCLKPSSFIRAWDRLYFITQAELKIFFIYIQLVFMEYVI